MARIRPSYYERELRELAAQIEEKAKTDLRWEKEWRACIASADAMALADIKAEADRLHWEELRSRRNQERADRLGIEWQEPPKERKQPGERRPASQEGLRQLKAELGIKDGIRRLQAELAAEGDGND